MPCSSPTVYGLDVGNTLRESLEMLIECAGWRPDTFSSEREFLSTAG